MSAPTCWIAVAFAIIGFVLATVLWETSPILAMVVALVVTISGMALDSWLCKRAFGKQVDKMIDRASDTKRWRQ